MFNANDTNVRLHYFKGRGRAETTRWMLAVNQIDFINIPLTTPEELAALRATGKMPFDQLPLLEIDGKNLSQSTAMIRYLARRGDLYGDTDDDMLWCDLVAGATADFAETAMQAAFQPTPDTAAANLRRTFAKFGPRFEKRLETNGGDYMAARRLTFADVVLAEALTSYLEVLPDILGEAPGLASLQRRVIEHPGIAAYLTSSNRWPMPDAQYVVDVARVLQRALPPHMPDADRFVAKS
jgi:glutathione S-transferase